MASSSFIAVYTTDSSLLPPAFFRLGIGYSFLFMKANGGQLREITRLIEAGAIRPVIDRVFPFESTNEALAYVEAGRAKGKVVVKIK
jgi:alcohol dehydrogenase